MRMLGRRAAAVAVAATALLASPEVSATPRVRDAVSGSGTVELVVEGLPQPVVAAFEFDLEARAAGRKVRGRATLEGVFVDAKVSCLEVRTMGTSPPFKEATMNVQTATFGLVTLQVSDGDPEGLPDFFSAQIPADRTPSDCSRLAFGADNVAGFVTTGEVDLIDAG
jgi:hypothetical protein